MGNNMASSVKEARERKRKVKAAGCNLPFYDGLDTYREEFSAIVRDAMTHHPSLVQVCEVNEAIFAEPNFDKLGCADVRQVFFRDEDGAVSDYAAIDPTATIRGSAYAFLDEKHNLRTLVLIPYEVPGAADVENG